MTAIRAFEQKFTRDWSMNLAAMLAYHLITTAFPGLLAVLSVAGMLLHAFHSAQLQHALAVDLNHVLPPTLQSVVDVNQLLDHLIQLTGPLAVVSLLGLFLAGSGLFSSMENAFSIIFRTPGRPFIRQKLMAGGMALVFAVLLSLALAAYFVAISAHVVGDPVLTHDGVAFNVVGLVIAVSILWLLFLLLYRVVPTATVPLRSACGGALVAAVLVALLNALFPVVFTLLLASNLRYGAIAATALVMVIALWLLALITVIGAQITALDMGVKPPRHDLARAHALDGGQSTRADALDGGQSTRTPHARPVHRTRLRPVAHRLATYRHDSQGKVVCHSDRLRPNRQQERVAVARDGQ